MATINVNGIEHPVSVDADTPLLWVLRDVLNFKGTKYGCGVGICGICTVLADGKPLRSCVTPLNAVNGRHIVTIEGLAEQGHRVLNAWREEQVPQCGYCQPGHILAAAALLDEHPQPDDGQIDAAMEGILCRCGTYPRIRRAIHHAARLDADAIVALPSPAASTDDGVELDKWIRIAGDGTVIITINHAEMGQGVNTALATVIAEQLAVNLEQVRTVFAPAAPRYRNPMFGEQTTGGSTSVRGEWTGLAEAGARARQRLIKAAAQHWQVRQQDCIAREGGVIHQPSERRMHYGELAALAKHIPAPKRAQLITPDNYRLIGRPMLRMEISDMLAGRTTYGLDLNLPDMRVATVQRCPVINGSLDSYDATAALAIPGVEQVFAISNGVAVVAVDSWSALQGQQALNVQWTTNTEQPVDSNALFEQLNSALEHQGEEREHRGRITQLFKQAEQTIEADYTTAPLAHGSLEPMNCTARISGDGCEVWLGTQSPEAARETAAQVSDLPLSQVRVHSLYIGGAFGRRLDADMVAEAVEIARHSGKTIQLLWTRIDDMQHDHYRPPFVARLRAVLDTEGRPLAWYKHAAGPNVSGQGWQAMPYDIEGFRSAFVETELPLPSGAWRAVGAGQDAFAVESFVDELAQRAGEDPLTYRLALLDQSPRHRAVLQRAAELAGWRRSATPGHYRGLAVYHCFGSYVAEVAEVSVVEHSIRLHRVVCVIDCGRIINPDTVRAQLEGGIAMGISAALNEAITVKAGRIQQQTFEDYPILTLPEMPTVEIDIIESDSDPGGVGEPGVPPLAPALANAVAAATGIRLRHLPLDLSRNAPATA
jgi:isoquinoline 1-oxidoreductase beta subunit